MFRSVRRNKRLVRLPFIILALALSIGLVSFFIPRTPLGSPSANQEGSTTPSAEETPSVEDRIQELAKAIQQAESELQKQPQNEAALRSLGSAHFQLGYLYLFAQRKEKEGKEEFGAAQGAYEKLVVLKPKDVEARLALATAAFYNRDFSKAQEQFKEALRLDPQNPVVHLNYGLFLWETEQNKEAALKHWEKVVAVDPQGVLGTEAKKLIQQVKEIN